MAEQHRGHELDLWVSETGDVLGAPVFLTPEEARKLQETGRVTIRLRDRNREEEHGRGVS